MKILVTGATGFVGRCLVQQFVGQHELYCVVRRHNRWLEASGCQIIQGDLAHSLELISLPARLDAIVHLASVNTPFPDQANESFQVIVASTQQLLDYGRRVGIQHFIYTSSGSVYGFGPRPWQEDDPLQPPNFYAVNKYCAELLIKAYARFFHTCILRLFFPYGPGQRNRRIPMIAERVIQGQPVRLVNNGQPRINPIYIDDLVKVIEAALGLDESVTVNVAGDEIIDMKKLAELIGQIAGKRPIFENTTDPSMSDLIGNNELMHRLFPLKSLTPLREGLTRMLEEMEAARRRP